MIGGFLWLFLCLFLYKPWEGQRIGYTTKNHIRPSHQNAHGDPTTEALPTPGLGCYPYFFCLCSKSNSAPSQCHFVTHWPCSQGDSVWLLLPSITLPNERLMPMQVIDAAQATCCTLAARDAGKASFRPLPLGSRTQREGNPQTQEGYSKAAR